MDSEMSEEFDVKVCVCRGHMLSFFLFSVVPDVNDVVMRWC